MEQLISEFKNDTNLTKRYIGMYNSVSTQNYYNIRYSSHITKFDFVYFACFITYVRKAQISQVISTKKSSYFKTV